VIPDRSSAHHLYLDKQILRSDSIHFHFVDFSGLSVVDLVFDLGLVVFVDSAVHSDIADLDHFFDIFGSLDHLVDTADLVDPVVVVVGPVGLAVFVADLDLFGISGPADYPAGYLGTADFVDLADIFDSADSVARFGKNWVE